jgi:DNA-binding Lrp family transcriptional regulator
MKLDDIDRKLLTLLQQDSRLTNAELAERVALSPSSCLRRLHLLLESGLVSGTHLVLDQKQAGFPGTAYVFITLEGQDRKQLDAFEARVKLIAQVQECYLLAGNADYLLRVVYNGAEDLERLHSEVLTRLPGIRRVQSTLTLRTVKRTSALPV